MNAYAFWAEGCRGGESEALLGRWMRERQNRSEIFLATKVGALPTVPGADLERAEGLSRQAIAQAVHASLRRLGTDYIDLCYAHIDFRWDPLEETLEAFASIAATFPLSEAYKAHELNQSGHGRGRIILHVT
jgi:aryl-alcohol dehydrogenase-like predicted oxidoreductase